MKIFLVKAFKSLFEYLRKTWALYFTEKKKKNLDCQQVLYTIVYFFENSG